jgi:hypothetical protein
MAAAVAECWSLEPLITGGLAVAAEALAAAVVPVVFPDAEVVALGLPLSASTSDFGAMK